MVTITDDAAKLLARLHTTRENSPTLRVIVEEGDFVLGSSDPAQDDEVYFHEGAPVLRVAAEAAKELDGFTFGTEDTTQGPTLAILSPGEAG